MLFFDLSPIFDKKKTFFDQQITAGNIPEILTTPKINWLRFSDVNCLDKKNNKVRKKQSAYVYKNV